VRLARREYTTNSADETRDLGKQVAAHLRPGDVIALVGPLGAGKTQFVKGLAAGLGVTDPRSVNSPTFVLVQEYHGRLTLYHLDAYRLGSVKELSAIGFDELCDAGGVVVVEWADRVKSLLPESAIQIEMTPTGETVRRINITGVAIGKTETNASPPAPLGLRFSRWSALVLTLGLLTTWVFSGFSTAPYTYAPGYGRANRFAMGQGCVWIHSTAPLIASRTQIHVHDSYHITPRVSRWRFFPGPLLPFVHEIPGVFSVVVVPLWMPLVLSIVATVMLWRLDRRRAQIGHCAKCNYNLTKNVSGRCPECGEPIPVPAA